MLTLFLKIKTVMRYAAVNLFLCRRSQKTIQTILHLLRKLQFITERVISILHGIITVIISEQRLNADSVILLRRRIFILMKIFRMQERQLRRLLMLQKQLKSITPIRNLYLPEALHRINRDWAELFRYLKSSQQDFLILMTENELNF